MSKTKNLPEIIKANPGCVAIIDNDCWSLHKVHPGETPFPDNYKKDEKWQKDNLLASDDDTFKPGLGDGGYGSGNCYGGDILQALALIVGVKVESV